MQQQHRRQPSNPGQQNEQQPSLQQQQQQQPSKAPARQPFLPPITVVPAAAAAAASHARQPSDPSEYSGSSNASHRLANPGADDDDEADGYGDLLDAYDEDDPRSPTSPITPRPTQPAVTAEPIAREGMQTLKLRDGSTIETPLPPPPSPPPQPGNVAGPSSGGLPFAQGRARARSISRDLPPSFADAPPLPPLPPTTTPGAAGATGRPVVAHSRKPTSGSSIDSPIVRTPPGAEPAELPDDRFVVSLGANESGEEVKEKESSSNSSGGGGGGWGKVKRGLTVRRKEVRQTSWRVRPSLLEEADADGRLVPCRSPHRSTTDRPRPLESVRSQTEELGCPRSHQPPG